MLAGVNLRFEAGKSYAVVGASGSGKSTLLGLLTASHEAYTGSVLYDGVELRDIRSESLYEQIAMIEQQVFVFNASIRENITMFGSFPKERVERAMQLAGLSSWVEDRGEEAGCGENGCMLSGGEKQRIAIARSLLMDTSVLLADEATAALDAQTARYVSEAILSLKGVTRIVVTHTLDEAVLRRFDGIVVLSSGGVAETGRFDELMEKRGLFHALYTVSQ